MNNLARLFTPKVSKEGRESLISSALSFIKATVKAEQVIVFGSVLSDSFDEYSDIDLLIIFSNQSAADAGRHSLYRASQPDLGHPLEMICLSRDHFDKMKELGGVSFVANQEGRKFIL